MIKKLLGPNEPCLSEAPAALEAVDDAPLNDPMAMPGAQVDEALDARIDRRLGQLESYERQLESLESPSSCGADGRPADATPTASMQLSIVVPAYNEVNTIDTILDKLLALDLPKEIIVVDDGSTDGTQEALARRPRSPDLRIILKPSNEGKGAALRTGFAHAQGDLVVVQDADLEYDPQDLPKLIQPILNDEADVVYGSRFLEERWHGSSFVHRLGNRLLTMASNLTTGLRLTDMETCYKIFRTQELHRFEIRQNRFGFEPEVTAKLARLGLRFQELPIHYRARDWRDGKKIGWRDAVNALYCIFRYRLAQ